MALDLAKARDLWCRTELVTTRVAKGLDTVVNRLVRRLTTKKGTLFYHPNWGIDVTEYVGSEFSVDGRQAQRMIDDVVAEVEDDPAILRGSCVASVTEVEGPTGTTFELNVEADTRSGPLAFVIPISEVTLEVLNVRRLAA